MQGGDEEAPIVLAPWRGFTAPKLRPPRHDVALVEGPNFRNVNFEMACARLLCLWQQRHATAKAGDEDEMYANYLRTGDPGIFMEPPNPTVRGRRRDLAAHIMATQRAEFGPLIDPADDTVIMPSLLTWVQRLHASTTNNLEVMEERYDECLEAMRALWVANSQAAIAAYVGQMRRVGAIDTLGTVVAILDYNPLNGPNEIVGAIDQREYAEARQLYERFRWIFSMALSLLLMYSHHGMPARFPIGPDGKPAAELVEFSALPDVQETLLPRKRRERWQSPSSIGADIVAATGDSTAPAASTTPSPTHTCTHCGGASGGKCATCDAAMCLNCHGRHSAPG